jgi:hypothetical protein
MRTKKQFTEHEKNFIRNNYLKLTEPQMANILGTTRFFIQKLKRDEVLAKYPYNRKKKEGFTDMEEVIAEAFVDIDEYLK